MIVAELRHGQLMIIDRLRETVRLSEGLAITGKLNAAARDRALACLGRFGERLRDMHASQVRAAGTSTLRRARDSGDFQVRAEKALGHPVEVISGIEEARLIYNGVLHSMPPHDGHRLVLDIGGGSTELIRGKGAATQAMESLHLGCVAMTERYFGDGRITAEAFEAARIAARLELRPVKAFFRNYPDMQAVGTSGTILSTERVARAAGVLDSDGLTLVALDALISRATELGEIAKLEFSGLSERRAQVWPGGLAILAELFAVLRIPKLEVSSGALREGLLYEQVGRLTHEDARERSVHAMAERYHVDKEQAARVAASASALLAQCRSGWSMKSDLAESALRWAAQLHEIGLDISHDGYQRHGAYVVANADMPGFPRSEQALLAYLISSQRRQLQASSGSALPTGWRKNSMRLAVLLRVAVLLNRNRSAEPLPEIRAVAGKQSLTLNFPETWIRENPLTLADLTRERDNLKPLRIDLIVDVRAGD